MAYLIGSASTTRFNSTDTFSSGAPGSFMDNLLNGRNTDPNNSLATGTAQNLHLYINSWGAQANIKVSFYDEDDAGALVESVIIPSSAGTGLISVALAGTSTITTGRLYRMGFYTEDADAVTMYVDTTTTIYKYSDNSTASSYTSPQDPAQAGSFDGTGEIYWAIDDVSSGDTATVTESSLTDGGTISGTYTKADQWASSDPDRGTVDNVPLTNFTAAAGVWSADNPDVYSIAEGLTYPTTAAVPDFGTVDVVISDVSYDAPAVSKAFNVKSGWAEVTLATVDTVTTEGLYLRINATVTPDRDIATTEKIYYDTVSGDVTVTDDGLYSLDGATNDFDFAVISATNNVDEAFQFSNLGGGGGGGTITRLLTNSLLTNTILKQGNV